MSVESEVKEAMNMAVSHLEHELKGLRTGRANPGILDGLKVEVYGTQMSLRDIANVTVPESRQLLITPFDPTNAGSIGKAIEHKLEMQTIVEANLVRVNIPPMDETARKEMVKQCKKKGEETKIAIREIRRKFNDQVRKEKAKGDLPEDMLKVHEKKIQELTDIFCGNIDKTCQAKEKEIISI